MTGQLQLDDKLGVGSPLADTAGPGLQRLAPRRGALGKTRQMGWTAPYGIDVPECGSFEPAEGAVHDEHYHDRARHRQVGLPSPWCGCRWQAAAEAEAAAGGSHPVL